MKKTTKHEYFYNDNGNIDHSVTTETTEDYPCDDCEEGELLTSEVEVTSETERALTTALVFATVGLLFATVSAIINRRD